MTTTVPGSTMRRDLISAYAVTAARVGSWVVVSAVVYRKLGPSALALITLVRATIGILTYTSLGLAPAMVKKLVEASAGARAVRLPASGADAVPPPVIAYAEDPPQPAPDEDVLRVYSTGVRVAALLAIAAAAIALLYSAYFDRLHRVPAPADIARSLAAGLGLGTVIRLFSDAPSALLQARGRIALDNFLLAASEAGWAAISAAAILARPTYSVLIDIGIFFAFVNLVLLVARHAAARLEVKRLTSSLVNFDRGIAIQLFTFGSLIVVAQLADFLYAPTDCILINHLISAEAVAWYSPAIQIDAGLLLLVSGLAAVLYPKSSLAHASGDVATLRRYYVRGTLASLIMLTLAALAVLALSPQIFRLWFNDDMPQTRAILPLLLIHTVVGGSSAVGRSVLLAVGRVKPFTAAVLIAGVANVILSYAFVRYGGLGLNGIVLGTIVVVIARCAIWQPWYVLRTWRAISTEPQPRL